MQLNDVAFNDIKSGKKTIEARIYDEKRKQVLPGDTLTFTNRSKPIEQLTTLVLGISTFRDFGTMFKLLGTKAFGYEQDTTPEDAASGMQAYYPAEEVKKNGVVGIHIRVIP